VFPRCFEKPDWPEIFVMRRAHLAKLRVALLAQIFKRFGPKE